LNLAILSEEQNKSKNDKLLKLWLEEQEKHNKDIRNTLLIPENIDLDFDNFEEFITKRETMFKELIKLKLK
jgi:alpha-D-ribose 1-methylphosphonate 5-triphosphate diphosphatase PhnM